ncbi:MAG: exo-alpha-sialidase [Planctomycetales bacterium]|nr:exo-alpha-sialidase [Planctomycetales bacterium]
MRPFTFTLTCILGISAAVMTYAADDGEIRPLSPELREKCLTVLRSALAGEEFWPAMHAAEALTLAGEGKSVVPLLEARLKTDNDPQHRCGLAREIVRTGKREPLAILWQTLADTKSNGRVHAAESLYKIGEVGDGKLLRAAMQDKENPKLRIMAAAALGRAGNQQALELIRRMLKSDDRELRKLAAWVLGLLGNFKDDGAEIQKLRDAETDPLTKSFFVNSLACLGDGQARQALAQNINSDDPAIRAYAADFAAWSRSLDAVKPGRLDDDNVDVRVRTAQALLAFTKPPYILGLPVAAASADIQVDATTEFAGGGADHATATIVAKTSTDGGRTWSDQRTLQENIGKQNVMSVTLRRLSHDEAKAPLGMFFLQKNSQTDLKVLLRTSQDEGQTFGEPVTVTSGPGYHVMNNDRVTLLSSGRLVCPISWSDDVFKKGSHFVCICFLSDDGGKTWKRSTDQVDQPRRGAMEPEVVELAGGKLLMIIRTQLGHIATSTSEDGGDHWSAPGKLPLDAPEAPATIRTIPATGDLLLIWNNTHDKTKGHGGDRTPLTSAISSDGGSTWSHVRNLETSRDHTYAYTSLLFHKDRVLLSYYVSDNKSGRISSRFRSLPVRWFYEN